MHFDSTSSRFGYAIAGLYLALVLITCVIAARRLAGSMDMPGLAAIELVLLAIPWSLLLGAPALREAGFPLMTLIVLGGVLINAVMLYTLGWRLQRWWRDR
jgi:hypothetical protein